MSQYVIYYPQTFLCICHETQDHILFSGSSPITRNLNKMLYPIEIIHYIFLSKFSPNDNRMEYDNRIEYDNREHARIICCDKNVKTYEKKECLFRKLVLHVVGWYQEVKWCIHTCKKDTSFAIFLFDEKWVHDISLPEKWREIPISVPQQHSI